MTYDELIAHFRTLTAAAKALRLPITTVNAWKDDGIPYGRQCQVQILTGGMLQAERDEQTVSK